MQLDFYGTLVAATLVLLLGRTLVNRCDWLRKYNIPKPVVGGLLVGILEAMGAGYISSSYKDAMPFVLILLILFFMPRGLFGGKSTDRV